MFTSKLFILAKLTLFIKICFKKMLGSNDFLISALHRIKRHFTRVFFLFPLFPHFLQSEHVRMNYREVWEIFPK